MKAEVEKNRDKIHLFIGADEGHGAGHLLTKKEFIELRKILNLFEVEMDECPSCHKKTIDMSESEPMCECGWCQ